MPKVFKTVFQNESDYQNLLFKQKKADNLLGTKQVEINVFASSNAGKSTLLNALLEDE